MVFFSFLRFYSKMYEPKGKVRNLSECEQLLYGVSLFHQWFLFAHTHTFIDFSVSEHILTESPRKLNHFYFFKRMGVTKKSSPIFSSKKIGRQNFLEKKSASFFFLSPSFVFIFFYDLSFRDFQSKKCSQTKKT